MDASPVCPAIYPDPFLSVSTDPMVLSRLLVYVVAVHCMLPVVVALVLCVYLFSFWQRNPIVRNYRVLMEAR